MPSTIPSDSLEATVTAARWQLLQERVREFLQPEQVADAAKRRSLVRYRRIAMTGFTSLGAKAIAFLTTILIVPLTFRYLGPERYGLWMTMTSFVIFLGFADAGIGNGLTAGIAAARGTEDEGRIARLVSCGFYFLAPLSIALFFVFFLLSFHVNWKAAYGLSNPANVPEGHIATLVLMACYLLNMPLGTVLRVQAGYQEGYLGDLWTAGGSVLGIIGLLIAIHHHGALPLLVAVLAGAPLLVTAGNWIHQFFYHRPTLRPRLHLYDWITARALLAMGGIFFLQQCFGLVYYTSDNMIIARTMGAVQVAHYALLQRIFSIGLITQYLATPLWPAVGEALARRDFDWVRRTARTALLATAGISIPCAGLLLWRSRAVAFRWSGIDPGPVDHLRLGFAVWVIIAAYIATMNALLNHKSFIRQHVAIFGVASIGSLCMKLMTAHRGSLALFIWSTNICFAVLYVIPTLLLTWRGFRAAESEYAHECDALKSCTVP